jgi:hypothetical protein
MVGLGTAGRVEVLTTELADPGLERATGPGFRDHSAANLTAGIAVVIAGRVTGRNQHHPEIGDP